MTTEKQCYLGSRSKSDRCDKPDFFKTTANGRKTDLAIYNSSEETENSRIYHRTFDKKQTKRVYLVGVADNDKTDLRPGVRIKIIKAGHNHIRKYDVRQKNLKLLGKSVNNLGQPGFKK